MPAFDTSKMSSDEFKFIRAYCGAVRRDYNDIESALALASRGELAIVCPFQAVKLAKELRKMQHEFEDRLATIGAQFTGKPKETLLLPAVPSFDEIGRIFAMSFFKVVDSETKSVIMLTVNDLSHDGWSSGRPSDWQYTLKSLYDIQKQKNSTGSIGGMIFSKLFKLFIALKSPQNLPDPYEEEYYDDEEDDDDYYNQFFN